MSAATLLYDGHCRLCSRAARQFRRLDRTGSVTLLSFREQGALAAFPMVSAARCERALQFVRRDGQVFEGAEAIVQVLQGRWFGVLARVYYLPGLRQAVDWLYRLVARHRFRIAGRSCPDGSCALHLE